jgi:hypothetical protein
MTKADYEAQYGTPEPKELAPAVEAEMEIEKDDWQRYYKMGCGYVKDGSRWIIRHHKRVPVTVKGMAAPRRRS